MKSERRHELRENDLQHVLELTRDYLAENGSRVGLILLGLLAVAVIANVAVRSSSATVEDAWARRKDLAFDTPEKGQKALEALQSIGEGTSDRDLALACLIDRGNHALALSLKAADPPDRKFTEAAQTAYQQLRDRYRENSLALAVALNGLASVEENLFALDGKMEHRAAAEKYLSEAIDNRSLAGLPLQQLAMDRKKRLDEVFVKVKLSYPQPAAKESGESEEGSDPADAAVEPKAP